MSVKRDRRSHNTLEDGASFFNIEYQELRSEQRFRYNHSNKLNTGFITFTTAVLTIGFGLSAFVNSILNVGLECKEAAETASDSLKVFYQNKFLSVNCVATGLEFLQALFFLTPIIYSKICFNHSLENSVRISLISGYLGEKNPNVFNWDLFRNKYRIRYFFGAFGSHVGDKRVGDLSNMHRIVSWLCIVLGMGYGVTTFVNCVMEGNFSAKNLGLFITIAAGLSLSAIAHMALVLVFKYCNKERKNRHERQKPEDAIKDINRYSIIQKRINTGATYVMWASVVIAYLLIAIPKEEIYFNESCFCTSNNCKDMYSIHDTLNIPIESSNPYPNGNDYKGTNIVQKSSCICKTPIMESERIVKNDSMEYVYSLMIYAYALIFLLFGMFCIWQFPCYSLECSVADEKITLHNKLCKKYSQKSQNRKEGKS